MALSDPAPQILLFEDSLAAELGPIADLRPAFEIRCGAFNLRERVELAVVGAKLVARVRPGLQPLLGTIGLGSELDATTNQVVLVNARLVASIEALAAAIDSLSLGDSIGTEGALWLARVELGEVDQRLAESLPPAAGPAASSLHCMSYPWQIVHHNSAQLDLDARWFSEHGAPERRIFGFGFESGSTRISQLGAQTLIPSDQLVDRYPGVQFIDAARVLVAETAQLRPGSVIDAQGGTVVLSPGVVVHPLSVVVGPAYLGPGTVVNPGAKLREGSSAGAFCKLGGEVEESVILDLSNKQHDGFLGHALVGSWVNLGADTNGSDLKNNYGPVRVDLGRGVVDSGETFVGPHLGDHVKTGIDTMLTTGAVAGICANIFGGGFTPRFVPAFAWGGAGSIREYRLDDALSTARIVFERRDALWSEAYERLVVEVFERTRDQRAQLG